MTTPSAESDPLLDAVVRGLGDDLHHAEPDVNVNVYESLLGLRSARNAAMAERDALRAERDAIQVYLNAARQGARNAVDALAAAEKERDVLRQTSANLCDDCGWSMKFPDAPCYYCKSSTLDVRAHNAEADLAAVKAERERLRIALAELVFLKRLKDNIASAGGDRAMMDGYEQRKPIAWANAFRELAALSPGDAGTAVVPDPNRCACCGWILQEDLAQGCIRGNCSMRPMPETMYDAERFAKEAGTGAT